MLVEESIWIKNTIHTYLKVTSFPLLNIGSSTQHFREIVQPHIDENVFLPLRSEGKKVIHLDMKMDAGVDIIGDLSDAEFRKSLKAMAVKSVLCSNLLEHLADPKPICNSILDLLEKGGLIIVTVPYNFPFHEDPIDTLFRPNEEQLHNLFKNTKVIDSKIVLSTNSYSQDLMVNKKYLMIMLARICMPFYKPHQWTNILKDFINAKKRYSATCIILEKQ